MLTIIHVAKFILTQHFNVGTTSVSKKGDLKAYITVWYHPDSIADILSKTMSSRMLQGLYKNMVARISIMIVHAQKN